MPLIFVGYNALSALVLVIADPAVLASVLVFSLLVPVIYSWTCCLVAMVALVSWCSGLGGYMVLRALQWQ